MSDFPVLLLGGSLLSYLCAAVAYAAHLKWHLLRSSVIATILFVVGFTLSTCLIGSSWIASGRPPFKTLYESLLLLVFCSSIMHLSVERFFRLPALGAGVSALMTVALCYAMAHRDLETVYLPPALQSPWFVPHVLVYFTGYAALLMAAVAAAAYLIRPAGTLSLERAGGPKPIEYRTVMHGLIIAGFLLITAGLILGSVWAKEAWGNYWSWDPKENWALISWLCYTLYFHVRRLPSNGDRLGALVAIGAFGVVLFTYLGINMLPTADSSMHVYQ